MLTLKAFLLEEVSNGKRLLGESLRYEYTKEKSKEFFSECSARLAALSEQIDKTLDSSLDVLTTLSTELNRLNALLARIERSHIGEFSWPFAESFEHLALRVLTAKSAGTRKPPLFFISSDGGLDAYRIFPEQVKGTFQSRQIFSINFPRSLKDHVLYHPILGHEMGHAAWTIPELQRRLIDDVLAPLLLKSALFTVPDAQEWIKTNLGPDLSPSDVTQVLAFWIQEYLSDIFGLLITGPSFLAAHRSLLSTLDVTGTSYMPTHPPNVSRFWFLDVAYAHLGWNLAPPKSSSAITNSVRLFNHEIALNTPAIPPAFMLFDVNQIRLATDGMHQILIDFNNTVYVPADASTLQVIVDSFARGTPAVATAINDENDVKNAVIDFRHILFAGWLFPHCATRKGVRLSFFDTNRMCTRSILHQVAIKAKAGAF